MAMWPEVEKRAVENAHLILSGMSIREIAKERNLSKSTIHKDVSDRLKKIDYTLYTHVQEQLDQNFQEKHIKGALATIEKYKLVWEEKKASNPNPFM
jgi:putative DeoR family transcriptional regulator, stage III sporulation protein D